VSPDSSLWYLFWVAVADIALAVWCWTVWRDVRSRVQFSILDFWAVMLALAPAMWLASQFEKHDDALCFLLLLIPHQIGGAFIFGNDALPGEERSNRSMAWTVGTTFTGAMLGWVVPFLTISVGFVAVSVLVLAFAVWPFTLLVLITLFFLRRRKKQAELLKDSA
jgi:hypothetical protein